MKDWADTLKIDLNRIRALAVLCQEEIQKGHGATPQEVCKAHGYTEREFVLMTACNAALQLGWNWESYRLRLHFDLDEKAMEVWIDGKPGALVRLRNLSPEFWATIDQSK